MTSPAPRERSLWEELRSSTQARIGLGRAGDALPTRRVLELSTAHAAARDAVHQPLDTAALATRVGELGLGAPVLVRSRAADRGEYLRRPDLGRALAERGALTAAGDTGADLAIVLADGLSPRALTDHGVGLLSAVLRGLGPDVRIAPPVIATQARVALGDAVAHTLRVRTLLVLIGERPGLSVADSLGIYLTHRADPDDFAAGLTDADRNCISNIHPPDGLGYEGAAVVAAALVVGARRLGRSGVDLKDTSRPELGGNGSGGDGSGGARTLPR